MSLCKKCGEAHEKPVNNKCEQTKQLKDEKHDSSKEHSAKKTSLTKTNKISPNEKVPDLVMSTMTIVLLQNSMQWRRKYLICLSHMDAAASTIQPQSSRKLHSRDKGRIIEISNVEEGHSFIFPARSLVTHSMGTTYWHVFPDTAMTFKTPIPVRVKKQKSDADLGVAPQQSSMVKLDSFLPSALHTTHESSAGTTSSTLPMTWEPPAT